MDKNKVSGFQKLKQQLKSGEIQNLYLFFGEETFIKDTYVKYMDGLIPDDSFSDFNKIYLDGGDAAEKIDDALDSFPMMSEKKLIIIKDSGIFKAKMENGSEIREFWSKRLSDIPDFVILIFDELEVDKRSSLYKTVTGRGLAVEFCYLEDYETVAWIVREAQKSGKKISKSSAEYLLSLCDSGLNNVKNELDKLIDYCGDEIYISDIDKVVSKPLNVVIFGITDAIVKCDRDSAVKTLLRLRENKTSAFNILYLLSSNFDKLLKCKLLLENGANYNILAEKLKINPNYVRAYVNNSKKFSTDYLIEMVCNTAKYDMMIKQGLMDEWTALSQYFFEAVKSL